MNAVLASGLTAILVACCALPCMGDDARPWVATGRRMMVAADSEYASRAGLEILKDGGNAVDAAAAVSFALAVVRPESTGLGGGGFMIILLAENGLTTALDYRERAPAAARADMFVNRTTSQTSGGAMSASSSCFGYAAAAVPGVVAGQSFAVARFGRRPLERILAPAIRLAEEGFTADSNYVNSAKGALDDYRAHPELMESCTYVYRVHLRSGELPKVGDKVIQPQLARLLREIARHGPDFFYKGPVAEAIERSMKKRDGVMTAGDLADYQIEVREPIRTEYRGYQLLLMPPPSSGGVCIAETLNILERFDLPKLLQTDSNFARHYFVEAMKHAFADRARWLGDPDSVSVPVERLTSDDYAKGLAGSIKSDGVSEVNGYGLAKLPDDAGTSHFCVVDAEGNCVVATETINTEFGSFAAVEDWGLILNNEMDDFTARPGQANAFDLVQSERNAPGPGKRPLSSMSPTMVLKDGKPVLLVGGSGGPRIISAVLNVLLNHLDGGQPLLDALAAQRIHHQWQPNEVYFDGPPAPSVASGLRSLGHKVSDRKKGAAVQAIGIRDGELVGVSDPRKGGRPAGE